MLLKDFVFHSKQVALPALKIVSLHISVLLSFTYIICAGCDILFPPCYIL